jgi:hypothetical protein
MQTLLAKRVRQRLHHVFLSNHFGKGARAPLAGENLCHGR